MGGVGTEAVMGRVGAVDPGWYMYLGWGGVVLFIKSPPIFQRKGGVNLIGNGWSMLPAQLQLPGHLNKCPARSEGGCGKMDSKSNMAGKSDR
eukprot:756071-Hanusia_phi.AAC.4